MKTIIIGNGPSLKEHLHRGHFDLFTQMEIETIAMNSIDWLYDPDPKYDLPGTDWRPTHWVWVEYLWYSRIFQPFTRDDVAEWVLESHVLPGIERCYIDRRFKEVLVKKANELRPRCRLYKREDVLWIERCSMRHGMQISSPDHPLDWHLPLFCVYGGTMNTALSMAFMFGWDDVGVIGCDLEITEPIGNIDTNHFHPRYYTHIEGSYEMQDDTLRHVHGIAKRNFEKWDRRIVNVGIGGELETYERVDLEKWLNE